MQLMALVVPFACLFLFGCDGLPYRTTHQSTSTHEQDVSEHGCLTERKVKIQIKKKEKSASYKRREKKKNLKHKLDKKQAVI